MMMYPDGAFNIFVTVCASFLISACNYSVNALLDRPITEKERTVLAGTTTSIPCTAANDSLFINLYEGQKVEITWKYKPPHSTNWLNLSNASFNWASEQRKHEYKAVDKTALAILRLVNVSVSQSAAYGCFDEQTDKLLDQTVLHVGYPPGPPIIKECRTNGHLTNMTCYWDPGRETYIKTTFRVFYNITAGLDIQTYERTTEETYMYFDVSCSYTFYYVISITASNALNTSHSQSLEIRPAEYVKPDPPTDVNVTNYGGTLEERGTKLFVTWTEPDKSVHLKLKYDVRYRRSYLNENWMKEPFDKNYAILSMLEPYTSYDIQVSAKPSCTSGNGFLCGSPSDWSRVVSYKTELLFPQQQFLFRYINATSSPDSSNEWDMSLLWLGYRGFDEPGFYYDISYSVSGKTTKLKLFTNAATFSVTGNKTVFAQGRYCNSLGCSDWVDGQVNLEKALPPIVGTHLSLQSNHLVLYWNGEDIAYPEENSCLIRICASHRVPKATDNPFQVTESHANSTTEEPTKCEYEPADDIPIGCSLGQFNMDFYDVSPCFQYHAIVLRVLNFEVSTNVHSSAIKTSSAYSNVLIRNPDIARAGYFNASDISDEYRYRISTEWEWTEQLCSNPYRDLLFSVLYSPKSGAECLEDRPCPRKNPLHSSINNCSQSTTSHDVATNIYGATEYELALGYCCKGLDEPSALCFDASSATVTVTTKTGGEFRLRFSHFCNARLVQVPGLTLKLVPTLIEEFYDKLLRDLSRFHEAPGKPTQLQWNVDDTITVSWAPPVHRNGPLDGYIVVYGVHYNRSVYNDTEDDDGGTEVITKHTAVDLQLSCSQYDDGSEYWVQVSAYNVAPDKKLTGLPSKEEGNATCSPTPEADYVILLIGMVVCLIVMILALVLGHYHRKRLKQTIRSILWPPIPVPNVLVHFPDDADDTGNSNGDLSNETTDYSNPMFRIASHDTDNATNEIPDDIHDTGNSFGLAVSENSKPHDTTRNGVTPMNIGSRRCCDVSNLILKDGELTREEHDLPSLPDTPYDGSGHSPYSVITPLLSVTSNSSGYGEYAQAGVSRPERSWRSVLYPHGTNSFFNSSTTNRRRIRPHSYTGSSGNSFTEAGYVRQCEERIPPTNKFNRSRMRSENNTGDTPEITYAKLAVDVDGGPAFVETTSSSDLNVEIFPTRNENVECTCTKTNNTPSLDHLRIGDMCTCTKLNLRRLRGESWYDGNSSYATSAEASHIQSNPQPNNDFETLSTVPSYVGGIDPYVVDPINPGRINIAGVTLDCSDDKDLLRKPENPLKVCGKANDGYSSGSLDSIDALYHGVRAGRSLQCDASRNNKNAGAESTNEEFSTEDDFLSYVKQSDTYVTVDEALRPPAEGIHTNHERTETTTNTFNEPHGEICTQRFQFAEEDGPYTDIPVNNVEPHLFERPSCQNNDFQSSDYVAETSEFGYITTAEAGDIGKR